VPIKIINGKRCKYLAVSQSLSPYIKQETFQVTEPDGRISQAWRNIEVQPESTPMDDFNLESGGWTESLLFSHITREEVFCPIPDSTNFKRSTALMLTRYKVTTSKPDTLLKLMPSGVFARTFKENGKDITISYFLSTNQIKEGNYKVISSKEISPKQARDYIINCQAHADLSLRRELGLPNT
jgi:hypothetical protein